jgi:hypothetical protein
MISERRLGGRYNARSPSTGGLWGGNPGSRALNAILRQLRYGAGHCMTLSSPQTRIFFNFRSFGRMPEKWRFSEYFTYENGHLAGGGIEPPTRGFSVHCSAN